MNVSALRIARRFDIKVNIHVQRFCSHCSVDHLSDGLVYTRTALDCDLASLVPGYTGVDLDNAGDVHRCPSCNAALADASISLATMIKYRRENSAPYVFRHIVSAKLSHSSRKSLSLYSLRKYTCYFC